MHFFSHNPSIHVLYSLNPTQVHRGAGAYPRGAEAYPSSHWVRGGVHPGQVVISHPHSLLGSIQSHQLTNLTYMLLGGGRLFHNCFCSSGFYDSLNSSKNFTNEKPYSALIRFQFSCITVDRLALQNGALSSNIYFNFDHLLQILDAAHWE